MIRGDVIQIHGISVKKTGQNSNNFKKCFIFPKTYARTLVPYISTLI